MSPLISWPTIESMGTSSPSLSFGEVQRLWTGRCSAGECGGVMIRIDTSPSAAMSPTRRTTTPRGSLARTLFLWTDVWYTLAFQRQLPTRNGRSGRASRNGRGPSERDKRTPGGRQDHELQLLAWAGARSVRTGREYLPWSLWAIWRESLGFCRDTLMFACSEPG